MGNWEDERTEINQIFAEMIQAPTADGSVKRQSGEKPSWKVDTSHEAAMFSHWNKWKHGEKVDPDSGAHPLVHLAWRALAIAWQEQYGEEATHVKVRQEFVSGMKTDSGFELCNTLLEYGRCILPAGHNGGCF